MVSQICIQNTGGYANRDNGQNNMNLRSSVVEMIEMFNINKKYACISQACMQNHLYQQEIRVTVFSMTLSVSRIIVEGFWFTLLYNVTSVY